MTPRPAIFPVPEMRHRISGNTVTPELGRFTAPGVVSKFCLAEMPISAATLWATQDDLFGPVAAANQGTTSCGWHGQESLLDALAAALGLPPRE